MGKIIQRENEVEVHFEPDDLNITPINIKPGDWLLGAVLARAAEDLVREKVAALKHTEFDLYRTVPNKLGVVLRKKKRAP